MTQSNYFSRIFGSSPVTPLLKHIDIVVSCVEKLIPYFESVIISDWELAAETQKKLVLLEHEADEIKNELRLNLPSSLFMAIDRRDVLEVLDLQDHIANKAKDISGLTLGRKMSLPESISCGYMEFLKRCIDATRQAQVAVNELDELVVTGFRGDEAVRVKKMIEELHVIEEETDEIQIKLRAELYKTEKELPPIDVMFIYKIIEWTGDLADTSQSTGNRLQLMLAK
ncbi:MAG: TIGR00153 family protein [Legionellales bacterium]|jgi:predicted phosphate transport protein (TIGR00153 family)|nr:TIGR00153 family protein [Legionellales bacterium]|tara:strand:+ start:168 stop:848 length:681 start_codon:yes stop_codon:yes gene_type:complete